jgi:hypothetical protein
VTFLIHPVFSILTARHEQFNYSAAIVYDWNEDTMLAL